MSVGVMTIGVMSVGEITVGVMTVGVMTVGVMRRPPLNKLMNRYLITYLMYGLSPIVQCKTNEIFD